MLWTTKQKDGSFRTIDTNKATMFDLAAEWFLMGQEKKERKARKMAAALINWKCCNPKCNKQLHEGMLYEDYSSVYKCDCGTINQIEEQ